MARSEQGRAGRRGLAVLLAFAALFGGGSLVWAQRQGAAPVDPDVGGGLRAFRSDRELRAYLRKLAGPEAEALPSIVYAPAAPPVAEPAPAAEAAADEAGDIVVTGSRASTPNITNRQEADVDEGGIVKVRGDTLVILRRGRLHTVSMAGGGLRPVDSINAFPPGVSGRGDWYDEMLLEGDRVVVIGYSYDRGGTEINRFRIDDAGRLTFLDAHHLKSNDYYSSSNYASRLIGSTLVFYAPLDLDWDDDPLDALPGISRWSPKQERAAFKRIAGPRRVFIPEALRRSNDANIEALHSVTTCDLSRSVLDCESTGVLGPESRNFYVSGQAVYLWLSDAWEDERENKPSSFLVRLPLDGARPSAIQTRGTPVDQFSFREDREDRVLNVVVRDEGYGDAMWRPQVSEGDAALLRLPLRIFGDGAREAGLSRYRPLPVPDGQRWFHNRFVGDHLLYGASVGSDEKALGAVYAAPVRGGAPVRLSLPHDVDRIEVLGRDALIVGGGRDGLGLSAVHLDRGQAPALGDRFVLADAAEGESRSHAYFFSPDARAPDGTSGTLGLPIARRADPKFERFFGNSAAMLFLRRDQRRFAPAGELDARPGDIADDGCQASCVDWYGNARPIFLGDRIFALLGYELVEGRLDGGRVREVRRADFSPRAAAR